MKKRICLFVIFALCTFSCSNRQYIKYEKEDVAENKIAVYFYTSVGSDSCPGTYYFQQLLNDQNTGINFSFSNYRIPECRFCCFLCDREQYEFIIKFENVQATGQGSTTQAYSQSFKLNLKDEKSSHVFILCAIPESRLLVYRVDPAVGEKKIGNCMR